MVVRQDIISVDADLAAAACVLYSDSINSQGFVSAGQRFSSPDILQSDAAAFLRDNPGSSKNHREAAISLVEDWHVLDYYSHLEELLHWQIQSHASDLSGVANAVAADALVRRAVEKMNFLKLPETPVWLSTLSMEYQRQKTFGMSEAFLRAKHRFQLNEENIWGLLEQAEFATSSYTSLSEAVREWGEKQELATMKDVYARDLERIMRLFSERIHLLSLSEEDSTSLREGSFRGVASFGNARTVVGTHTVSFDHDVYFPSIDIQFNSKYPLAKSEIDLWLHEHLAGSIASFLITSGRKNKGLLSSTIPLHYTPTGLSDELIKKRLIHMLYEEDELTGLFGKEASLLLALYEIGYAAESALAYETNKTMFSLSSSKEYVIQNFPLPEFLANRIAAKVHFSHSYLRPVKGPLIALGVRMLDHIQQEKGVHVLANEFLSSDKLPNIPFVYHDLFYM